MLLFIFGKEASAIKAEARADERARCDKHYLEEQCKQRKQYAEDKDRMRKAHDKELKDNEESLIKHYSQEITDLHAVIAKKNVQLRNSQDAWDLFKGVLPEIKNYASIMETKAKAMADMKIRDLASAREIDNQMESIQRKMRSIEPQVDKLLGMDEVPLMIDRK